MTKRTIIKNLRKLSIRYKCNYEYYLDRENGVYNATIKGDDNQRIKDYLLKQGFNYCMLGASFMDYDLGICVRVRGIEMHYKLKPHVTDVMLSQQGYILVFDKDVRAIKSIGNHHVFIEYSGVVLAWNTEDILDLLKLNYVEELK